MRFCAFPARWYEPDGDTAEAKPNAGGGIPSQRLPMKAEDAVQLYRLEKERRAA